MILANWRYHRPRAAPSAEAVAAIEAADRSHAQALGDLAHQESREPLVREARQRMQAHNEANHWAEWLRDVSVGRGPVRSGRGITS